MREGVKGLESYIGQMVWYRMTDFPKRKGILKAVLGNAVEIEDSYLDSSITYIGNVFLTEEDLDRANREDPLK